LHQAKVNKLTHLKKAMLEKMFPKQGADLPEIRFQGFAGAWKKVEIGRYW
jgi:type I restriction enzyme S subunit